ncbi:MAG: outer membrane beta-barrel protein [Rickettsiales bacterium]|jgi:opacity protein-like surface antigen|nr:outer membrane beta-barrel protein [Rickettsiales bacterium]
MNNFVNRSTIGAMIIYLITTNALAVENFYVQGNLGYAMGVAPGGDFSKNTLGDAGVYSAAVGYKFDDHIRMDVSLEYRDGYTNEYMVQRKVVSKLARNGNKAKVVYAYSTDTQITKVSSLASMMNLYYDIAEINKITPYVMLGAGISRNITDSSGNIVRSDNKSDIDYTISRGTRVNFAWKVGAGLQYRFNNDMSGDFHYQYVDLGSIRTGNIHTINNKSSVQHNFQGCLKSHEVLLGVKYKF